MFGWLKRSTLPEFVQAYRHGTARKPPQDQPWRELKFIVLDAETTGFNPISDRLLSVATVPIVNGHIDVAGRRSWLVRQVDMPNNEAVKIHGITPAASAEGKPEYEVLRELLGELTGAVMVGHHIAFDAAMLTAATQRHFGINLRNPVIDTAAIAMRRVDAFHKTGYVNQKPPSLEELCAHANLPITARHTASGDAFTTAQIFLWFCGRLKFRLKREPRAEDLR